MKKNWISLSIDQLSYKLNIAFSVKPVTATAAVKAKTADPPNLCIGSVSLLVNGLNSGYRNVRNPTIQFTTIPVMTIPPSQECSE